MASLALTATVLLAALDGCRRGSTVDDTPSRVAIDPASLDGAVDAGDDGAASRAQAIATARAALAAGTYDGPMVGAMNLQTSVMSLPAWSDEDAGLARAGAPTRLGYLRHGAKVAALDAAIVNDDCPEGWYELVEGGWVCGRAATLDLKHPRVRLAPAPPDMRGPLPYRYGFSVANGTPLYRRVLSVEDRRKFEPWLGGAPATTAKSTSSSPGPATANGGAPSSPVVEGDPPATASGGTSGATDAPVDPGEEREERPTATATTSGGRATTKHGKKERHEHEEDTSWFTKAPEDGGRPRVRLEDLHGRGVLVRRMVRGFYVALDREFTAAHAHWWRTTAGFAVPFDRIMMQPPPSEFHGTWFTQGGAAKAPNGVVGFVTSEAARKLLVDRSENKVSWGEPLPKRSAVALTGETFVQNGITLHETTEGFWVQMGFLKEAKPTKAPADLLPNEKWIDVDLTRQALVAFEGDKPVFATLISSGRRNLADSEHDYPTPTGMFRIREKHVSATMDGDIASDGPYSIEDVPWIMYFQGSYALHGAFWHSAFGTNRSHGCVNLSPADARGLFEWTEPHLPQGWHGVFPTDEHPGTRVVIHDDTPTKR